MSRQSVGRYIVIDSEICYGKPTFNGTRIMVADVLEMVATGRDLESISKAWGDKVSREAIAEAVNLASQLFTDRLQTQPYFTRGGAHVRSSTAQEDQVPPLRLDTHHPGHSR